MLTARARKADDLNTCENRLNRSPKLLSRLARSTCCQRPIRFPPRRRAFSRTQGPTCLSLCPRKPFKLTATSNRLSIEIRAPLTFVLPVSERFDQPSGALYSILPDPEPAVSLSLDSLHPCLHLFRRAAANGASLSQLKIFWRFLRSTLKPFEVLRPRIPDPVARITLASSAFYPTDFPAGPTLSLVNLITLSESLPAVNVL
jgi:hypothetical protein